MAARILRCCAIYGVRNLNSVRVMKADNNLNICQIRKYTTETPKPDPENQERPKSDEANEEAKEAKSCKDMTHEELMVECTTLRESTEKADEEIKVVKNRLAYALADIDNVRKISRKDVSNAREFALKDFGKDLLDVIDNCERALSIFPEECKVKGHQMAGIYTGLEMTANVMLKVFDKHGLVRMPIELRETVFDPNLHDALFQQPVEGLPAGIVFAVLKSGWTINGRVLRAAQVGVSAEPPEAAPEPAPADAQT